MVTTIKRFVEADKIVTVTTEETKRTVDFDSILESVSVEYDDWTNEAPWESCDGYEHSIERANFDCNDNRSDARGFVLTNDGRMLITISDDILEMWGNFDYYHAAGCSKQVSAELVAQVKRKAMDQLVNWYSDGWSWYSVSGEYQGYAGSIGGIDSECYAEDCRVGVANEIAGQMEADGFIIENRPEPVNSDSRARMIDQLEQNKRFGIVESR
jgi:hypothetical protein